MRTVPAFVLVAGLAAVAMIVVLQQRSDASRRAQVELEHVSVGLNQIQWAPIDGMFGMPAARVRAQMRTVQAQVSSSIADLQRRSPTPALDGVDAQLRGSFAADGRMLAMLNRLNTPAGRTAIAAWLAERDPAGLPAAITQPLARAQAADAVLSRTLGRAGDEYAARASRAKLQAMLGSSAAIVLLVLAFGLTYRRSLRARAEAERFAAENAVLAEANRQEAITDALTGLGNRRALSTTSATARAGGEAAVALALFDLDGFKHYNDTFGHPAGDALLAASASALTESLAAPARPIAWAATSSASSLPAGPRRRTPLVARAAAALSEPASLHDRLLPRRRARSRGGPDRRRRPAARRPAHVRRRSAPAAARPRGRAPTCCCGSLTERDPDSSEHVEGVGSSPRDGRPQLGLADAGGRRTSRWPPSCTTSARWRSRTTILAQARAARRGEWAFMRRHTLIGERILARARRRSRTPPRSSARATSASTAAAIRTAWPATHPARRADHRVCDAYDAMTADRPYRARDARGGARGAAPLRRHAVRPRGRRGVLHRRQLDRGPLGRLTRAFGFPRGR